MATDNPLIRLEAEIRRLQTDLAQCQEELLRAWSAEGKERKAKEDILRELPKALYKANFLHQVAREIDRAFDLVEEKNTVIEKLQKKLERLEEWMEEGVKEARGAARDLLWSEIAPGEIEGVIARMKGRWPKADLEWLFD